MAPPVCCHLGGAAPSLPALPTGGPTAAQTTSVQRRGSGQKDGRADPKTVGA